MPLSLIERLLFAQGGLCFFCSSPLPRQNATVEHLDAKANGGTNADKNCVACCNEINTLLGSMSLKEKIRVILNQNGKFVCPKKTLSAKPSPTPPATNESEYSFVLANLKKLACSKPKRVETLKNTIRRFFVVSKRELTEPQLVALLEQFQSSGAIQITGTKVSYPHDA